MHVLLITGEYPPLTGGVGAYTATLAHHLAMQGLRVSVLTTSKAKPACAVTSHPPNLPEHAERSGGLRHERCLDPYSIQVYPVIKRWEWGIFSQVLAWAKRLDCDWIHVQYQTSAYDLHPAINLAPWWWRRRVPVAWTYHDLLGPKLFPKAGKRLRKWVVDWPSTVCDLTIVTNEADRRALHGLAKRLQKVPIGSNIKPVQVGTDARTLQRSALGYTDDDLVVGYFGFLNQSKGGLTLVRALQRLTTMHGNAHLLMIGDRVGASDPTNVVYLQEVEDLARQLGVAGRIRWTGHLSDADVSRALAACDVLLMPYEDGASLRRGTLMAGLAHGCAIVTTTPVDPLPELVDGHDILFVPVQDADASAAAVMRIASEPELAARLRVNASARSQLFAWEQIAEQHQILYVDVDG